MSNEYTKNYQFSLLAHVSNFISTLMCHTQFEITEKNKSYTFIPANGASPWNSSRQSVELDSDTELECNDPLDAVDL